MFTKDKILKFLLVLAVFAAADLWIYISLRSSVRSSAATTRTRSLDLLAMSAPADPAMTDEWLKSVGDSLSGGAAVYLVPSEADPEVYDARAIDDGAMSLWNTLKSTPDAKKGLESAYYFENYASPARAVLGDTPIRLFYAPITDEAKSELLAIAVFMVPETADSGIERLLLTFAIGAFVLFAALSGISRFTRDTTVGYA